MASTSICRNKNCATIVEGSVKICPNCNGPMINSGNIRQIGLVMTIFGAITALPMLYVIPKFLPVFLNPELAVAEGRFGAPAELAPFAMALLLSVFAFCASSLIFGLQRLLFAKRSALTKPILLSTGLIFFALLFYVGNKIPDNMGSPSEKSSKRN